MKEKNLFDILENAENNSMKRLIEKCPEISDEQLARIYAKSEKKFRAQREEENGTMRDDIIKMKSSNVAEGVERSKRPAWLAPLSTAASMILIAGIVIGSTLMLNRNHKPNGGGGVTPAVTVTTSTGTGTTMVTSGGSIISGATTTVTTADKASAVTTSAPDNTSDNNADTKFIEPFTGKWKYQVSSVNNLDRADTIENKGIVQINGDATYTYTDNNGNVSKGTVTEFIETIGDADLLNLEFSGDEFIGHRAAYIDSRPYELHFGNGYAARLLRDGYEDSYGTTASFKTAYREVLNDFMNSADYCEDSSWDLRDLDSDGTPELLISKALFRIAGVRIYYYDNGNAVPVLDDDGQIKEYGFYGEMEYSPAENLIGLISLNQGQEYISTDKYENHKITQLQLLGNNKGSVGYEDAVYTIDHVTVSEEEYNKALNERASKNWISAGRQYNFNDFSALD